MAGQLATEQAKRAALATHTTGGRMDLEELDGCGWPA